MVIFDSFRGIAVLGILLMNISAFGLPSAINDNPMLTNEKGINFYCWYIFGHGIFEGSFRSVFSMLFGASIIILIGRLEKRAGGQIPSELFIRRQLWLLVFGLFNAYILLWHGDILFHYAICGIVIFPFRRLQPRRLLIASLVCLILLTIRSNIDFYNEKTVITRGGIIENIDTTKTRLSDNQKATLAAAEAIKHKSKQETKKREIEAEIKNYRASYPVMYKSQGNRSLAAETYGLYYFHFWDVLVFMFLGMALFKLGILQGEAKTSVYAVMAVTGLLIGLPLSRLFLQPFFQYQFDNFQVLKHKSFEFYELQRFVRSIGIFGLIMLVYKSGIVKRFFTWMQPVGKMAFTNYISQSFLCGVFFYGFGFGMFGKLQRYELYYVVCFIWLIQIAWSHLWLRYFYWGPLEWLWRSLTYWKIQPLKKTNEI